MNIEIYQGPFITANSALNYINPLPIMNIINQLKEELNSLQQVKDKLLEAKSYCSKEYLYIEGISIEDQLEDNINHIENIKESIREYLDNTVRMLEREIEEKQLELNEKAKLEERLLEKERTQSL